MNWLARFWDWIDERDIDKHIVSGVIMAGTYKLTEWAIGFATNSNLPGIERAAVIGAVTAPYMALQAAAIKFYFDTRAP